MYRRLIFLASLFLTLASSVEASPKVVQALVVDFPVNGRVIVQAREEVGNFPEMLFVSEKSGKVLLRHSIKDKDKWLIPDDNKEIKQPVLRFRVIRSRGFATPLIASVGAWYGTSDNAFYLTAFGEIQGQIKILMPMPVCANIQGGYYLGYINEKLGYGLVVWNFIWDESESHYTEHKYEAEIFKLNGEKFHRIMRRVSKRKYGDGSQSLHEIGIYIHDQRTGIPIIKDSLN